MEKPEHKIRVGAVSATVWKRTHATRDGRTFTKRQVCLDRTYKDGGGEWRSTNSYDLNDIPKAVLALEKAYDYLAQIDRDEDPRSEAV
jgi:hypothetical protein